MKIVVFYYIVYNILKDYGGTMQTIYINLDDSGVLHINEPYCVYGGMGFGSKNQRDSFMRKYKAILENIRCKYCHYKGKNCKKHKCPEIKDTMIRPNHKRQIFNLLKKQFNFSVIIDNSNLYGYVMSNSKNRGAYRDYAQRRLIKEIIRKMIKNGTLNPYNPVKLVIRIDQHSTSTVVQREFINEIRKELTGQIYNSKHDKMFSPVLFSTLDIDLKYVLSHRHICIQASDMIAGETRKIILKTNDYNERLQQLDFLSVLLFLP